MTPSMAGHLAEAVFVGIVTLSCLTPCSAETCTKISSCSFECSDGRIDLKSLASSSGPRFKDYPSPVSDYSYSYNPCTSFTETSDLGVVNECQSVASCQVIDIGGAFQYYDTGTQETVTFDTADAQDYGIDSSDTVVVAKYFSNDEHASRETEVVLKCEDDVNFVVVGEIPLSNPPTYRYVLYAPEACFNGGLSAGTILIIVCICLAVLYLVGGVLINKFVRHNDGKQLLPNYGLWSSLPGLVKDGFLFVVKRGSYRPTPTLSDV